MRPTLFRIGPIPVYGYGLMLATAFLVATYLAARRAGKEGIPSQTIFDLSLVLLVSAVIGARIYHVLQHLKSYSSFTDAIAIWRGGLSGLAFYGGFALALVAGILYLRHKRLPIARVMDIIAPFLLMGVGIGRIGCFLAGCCFGKPTSLPWGVTFPEGSLAWMELGRLEKVHPTQIYSLLSLFTIFVILLALRKYMKFPGQLFLVAVLMYSVHRFFIDFLRYYTPDEYIGSLATSQVMSIAAAIPTVVVMVVLSLRRDSKAGTVKERKPKRQRKSNSNK